MVNNDKTEKCFFFAIMALVERFRLNTKQLLFHNSMVTDCLNGDRYLCMYSLVTIR
jgi:hypothetical protein